MTVKPIQVQAASHWNRRLPTESVLNWALKFEIETGGFELNWVLKFKIETGGCEFNWALKFEIETGGCELNWDSCELDRVCEDASERPGLRLKGFETKR